MAYNEEGRKHEVICMEFLLKPPLEVQTKDLKTLPVLKYYTYNKLKIFYILHKGLIRPTFRREDPRVQFPRNQFGLI
jgi:hypothetical protein